ncbi:hypothetical protein [Pelomonas sp. SE-A7]|uniref:hypothetical protein n=1 Tax=Pelomonas sp. SE-A7 TaxID=3054953 RepID=UPI00259C6C59|nr:hypothetical protein [Pelomonas sp. SE-A7]MDM4764706.1 hypothetical protein [Pelomonas sp. SE-A7]
MKRSLVLASLMLLGASAAMAADVGVSISIGQPGFYGRIDIGNMQPRYYNVEPMIIERVAVRPAPIYLRVPPGHQKDWRKHCHHYNACGVPVYFVRDDWYEREYVPRYRDHYDRDAGRWREDDRRDGRRDDRRGDDDRGHGKGKGHGKGHGKDRDDR